MHTAEMATEKLESSESPKKKEFDIEEILKMAGGFGRFQIVLTIVAILAPATDPISSLDSYFYAKTPDWKCAPNSTLCNSTDTFSADDRTRCQLPRSDWMYTREDKYSMITDFDIDCDKDWQIQIAAMSFFIGTIVSAVMLGWISDNFGRKRVLLPGLFIHLVTSILRAFTNDIWSVTILLFISGMASSTGYPQLQVIGAEFVPARYRSMIGPLMNTTYAVARIILTIAAYATQEWRLTIFVGMVPFFSVYIFLFFLPESVQWLNSKNRSDEAMNILRRIARLNGHRLPENITIKKAKTSAVVEVSSPCDLFGDWPIARKTLVLCTTFFTVGAVYYGLSLAADDISLGSMYLSFFLISLTEIPATIFSIYFLGKIGRKGVCCLALFMIAISLGIVAALPHTSAYGEGRLALAVLGGMFASVLFMSIFVWTIELYPTLLRNQAVCLGFAMGKLGSSASRWIAKGSKKLHRSAPLIILTSMALVAGLLGLTQPETLVRSEKKRGKEAAVSDEVVENTHADKSEEIKTKLDNEIMFFTKTV